MNYNNILLIISLILAILILLSILYGCKFNHIENFADTKKNNKNNKKNTDNKDNIKEDNKDNKLSPVEEKFLDGIKNGSLDQNKISDLIKKGKFTKTNLENMITHIEKFKSS